MQLRRWRLEVLSNTTVEKLVYFLNCWATSTTWCSTSIKASTRHATLWHATTASSLVHLHHNWIHDTLKLLLLGLKFILLRELILVQPVEGLLHSFLNLVFVVTLKLILQHTFIIIGF